MISIRLKKFALLKGQKRKESITAMLRVFVRFFVLNKATINILRKFVSSRSVIVRSARDASINLPPPFFLYSPSLLLSCPTVTRGFRSRSKNGSVGLTLMRFLHGMKRFRGGYARLVCHIYNPLWPWTLDRESRSSRATSMPGFHVRGRDFLCTGHAAWSTLFFAPSLPFPLSPRLPFPPPRSRLQRHRIRAANTLIKRIVSVAVFPIPARGNGAKKQRRGRAGGGGYVDAFFPRGESLAFFREI